jgi:hypothetical protein
VKSRTKERASFFYYKVNCCSEKEDAFEYERRENPLKKTVFNLKCKNRVVPSFVKILGIS